MTKATTLPEGDRVAPTGPAGGMEVYEDLRRRGIEAYGAGRLDEALSLLESAWEWARESGDPVLVDRAFLNCSTVLLDLGDGDKTLPQLREILVRNLDPVNCRLAAYNIAQLYELRKEVKKGLFYARIASSWTQNMEAPDPNWVASDLNQIANFLVAESQFEQAIAQYRRALELLPEGADLRRAQVWDNLGYCLLVQKSYSEGFELVYRALRILRRLGAGRAAMIAHLDLAYGHLEVGRYPTAARHAAQALQLAERHRDRDALKNALYLSGEAANLLGREDEARAHFERLQRYFPESPFVTDFLLAIDVRKMINLRA